MILLLRALWLTWLLMIAVPALMRTLEPGWPQYDFQPRMLVDTMLLSALALLPIALSFGRQRPILWALVVIAVLWAGYFLLSLVAGDEGVWYAARLPPAVGLLVSVLTAKWGYEQLRRPT